MERRLQLLDSFPARGTDGRTYRVHGYEHLVRDDHATMLDAWEPTGRVEYRLADGGRVRMTPDGALRIERSGVVLGPA